MSRMRDSRAIILQVCGGMREWNPETAPQAMVMQKTERPAGEIPGGAVDEAREGCITQNRPQQTTATASAADGSEFQERAEIIARR